MVAGAHDSVGTGYLEVTWALVVEELLVEELEAPLTLDTTLP